MIVSSCCVPRFLAHRNVMANRHYVPILESRAAYCTVREIVPDSVIAPDVPITVMV